MLLEELRVDSAIMVGYDGRSGGLVGCWKRHREQVDGLVLCSTSHAFVTGMRARGPIFTSMMAAGAGTTRAGQLATMLPRLVVPARAARWRLRTGPTPSSVGPWGRCAATML